MSDTQTPHIPVMLDQVLDHLCPQAGDVVVDCTFGAGGYSHALLQGANCKVIAIDRDPNVLSHVQRLEKQFGKDRFHFTLTEFSQIQSVIQQAGLETVNAVVADLGISSMQIDEGSRGFSFRHDAPLDMRMTPDQGASAADMIADTQVDELTSIFRHYGEERHARRIALAIERERAVQPILRTQQLADIIRDSVPKPYANGAIHPATRVFQALRITVNDELTHIEHLMRDIPACLAPGGRFVGVSFHSLEDGIIKRALKAGHKAPDSPSRYVPLDKEERFSPIWSHISKKPLQPTEQECQNNPRARSAKLRWAVRSKQELN